MPVLEISLQSARTMLIIGGVLAGLGIAMLIISVAVFIASASSWSKFTVSKRSLKSSNLSSTCSRLFWVLSKS